MALHSFDQVHKEEARFSTSSFCGRLRQTVTSRNGVSATAMLEEHLCAAARATTALPVDNTFSKCFLYAQFVGS